MQFANELFFNYTEKLKSELSLLEEFELPPFKKWIINWKQIEEIELTSQRKRWNVLPIYSELFAYKNSQAIYYFTVNENDSQQLFDLFAKSKNESSRIRREKGVREKGFKSISHVPKEFKMSNFMYVGSRKNNIHERFKQHLGYASGRTGALHMASVFALKKSIPEITFHYHILDVKYVNLTEHIECVVQNKLKPFIGKNTLRD